ncbi:MGDG synthase family glycosyltransferase [Falsibacillus albus]|uniref:Diacylglycerol glucosyltransferase N-terminal domain-containing protein n=1 Tax=Falsibacillus albus TaxID=2478915 RepID=A0A3L7JQV7_9BACI|nr:hypothetical protein [Falsibacillus albus]RLQ93193.1 hypothetical protein D9X91_18340 [Falsibacillus albus]
MKVLVLPLFQMPSGHHQAADAMIEVMSSFHDDDITFKKVDFLSYCHPPLERKVSGFYLHWITENPKTYSRFYKLFMFSRDHDHDFVQSLFFWNRYFEWRMEQFILEEDPDLIICTHCYPSKLLDSLKQRMKLSRPVINVYTDFFINDIWGKKAIDYHLAPNQQAKEQLMAEFQVPQERIFVTGIPTFPVYHAHQAAPLPEKNYILIAGGNSGLGNMFPFLKEITEKGNSTFTYKVLCGKNRKLYNKISELQNPDIIPLSYIDSPEKMNDLYNGALAILTKPGGITISEALSKALPIFVLHSLPGQEEINKRYLLNKGLIFELDLKKNIEGQFTQILFDSKKLADLKSRIELWNSEKDASLSEALLSIIHGERAYLPSISPV